MHQEKNPLRKGHIFLVTCVQIYLCVGIFLALIFGIATPCFSQGIPSLNNAESAASKKSNVDENIELPGLNKLIEESEGLFADLEEIRNGIAKNLDLVKAKNELGKIQSSINEISPLLEQLKENKTSQSGLRIRIQSQLEADDERLQKIRNRLSDALNRIQEWVSLWKKAEKQWNKWQSAAGDSLVYDAVQPIFKKNLSSINEAEKRLSEEIQPIVVTLEKVWQAKSQIDGMKRKISDKFSVGNEDMLGESNPPMYSLQYFSQFRSRLDEKLIRGIKSIPLPRFDFLKHHWFLVAIQLLMAATIAFYFRKNPHFARESKLWTIFARRYMATGVFVSIFFMSFFYDSPPALVELSLRTLVAITAVRLIAALFDDVEIRRLLYLLITALILTTILQWITFPAPLFRLYVTTFSVMGALLTLVESVRINKKAEVFFGSVWGLRAASILFFAIFFAGVFGFSHLARFMFDGLIQTLSLVLIAWILVLFLKGCLESILFSHGLQKFDVVSKNRSSIQSKGIFVISVLVIGMLVAEILVRWNIFPNADDAFAKIFSYGVTIGSKEITVGLVLAAGLVLYCSFIVSWTLQTTILAGAFSKRQVQGGVGVAISKLLHYAIVLIGVLLAVSALGFELKNLTIIGGALGVGIGFGMQTIVNNFICGLIMLFERPVKIGDTIEVEGTFGVVKRLGLRATVVETYDHAEIVIPNTGLITENVTNWTLAERQSRLKISVGVAYGSEISVVKEILMACAEENEMVLGKPEPLVFFMGFGESALNFELKVWTDEFDNRFTVISDLNQEIDKRFRDRGIEIPFPQMDLHVRSADEKIMDGLSHNDKILDGSETDTDDY